MTIPGEWVWEGQNYRVNTGFDFENVYVVSTGLDVDGNEGFPGHLETFKNMSGNEGKGLRKPNPAPMEDAGIPDAEPRGTGDVNVERREEVVAPGGEGLEGFEKKTGSLAKNKDFIPEGIGVDVMSGIHFSKKKQENFLVNTSVLLLN